MDMPECFEKECTRWHSAGYLLEHFSNTPGPPHLQAKVRNQRELLMIDMPGQHTQAERRQNCGDDTDILAIAKNSRLI